MFQFQLYFYFLMYHIHHVLNNLYHGLFCCTRMYDEFAEFQVNVDFVHLEYHQHLCQIQNLVLTCLIM